MLTNILNTIVVAVGTGSAIATPTKTNTTNRNPVDIQINEYSKPVGTTEDIYNVLDYWDDRPNDQQGTHQMIGTSFKLTKYSGTGSGLTINAVNVRQETWRYQKEAWGQGWIYHYPNDYGEIEAQFLPKNNFEDVRPNDGADFFYSKNNIGTEINAKQNIQMGIQTATNIALAQEITFIKVNATSNYINTELEINDYGQLGTAEATQQQQNTQNKYIEYITTSVNKNTDAALELEQYFNTWTAANYQTNYCIYDKYRNILLEQSGYQTNINYTNRYFKYYDDEINYTIPLNITPNKVNYIVIMSQIEQVESQKGYIINRLQNYNTNGFKLTAEQVINSTNTEVIDIPGIMFDVLGMPFTFISAAFNLTIFPGTQYAVNISHILLALIATLVFVFIIKLLISKVGK